MRLLCRVAALAAVALIVVPVASAHVTVHPDVVAPGEFTVLDVRVPNERDTNTTKVDVQMPPGFVFAATEPVPGWTAEITYRKLATPVTVEGEKHTEEADHVIWTATDGGIGPNEFVELPLSVAIPEDVSDLEFKALQTYSDGEVVRWIGAEGSELPAAHVAVAAPEDDDGTDVLPIVAIVLAAVALGVAVWGVVRR
jgi:uncharacterized protein YcnI